MATEVNPNKIKLYNSGTGLNIESIQLIKPRNAPSPIQQNPVNCLWEFRKRLYSLIWEEMLSASIPFKSSSASMVCRSGWLIIHCSMISASTGIVQAIAIVFKQFSLSPHFNTLLKLKKIIHNSIYGVGFFKAVRFKPIPITGWFIKIVLQHPILYNSFTIYH